MLRLLDQIKLLTGRVLDSDAIFDSLFADGKFCANYTHRGLISKAKVKAIKYSVVIILGK